MHSSSIYTIKELLPKLWSIDENGEDTIYLIAGDERALLIDTGWGLGDLAGLVASLIPLPLLVVNTHGHPDHVCGNGQFTAVHIHPNDIPLLEGNFLPENREWMINGILGKTEPQGLSKEGWINTPLSQVIPVRDGFTFDLGGRTVEVIESPGHSPGCICLRERNEDLLFTGDTVLQGQIWLHLDHSMPLPIFRESVLRLTAITNDNTKIFPGHSTSPLTKVILSQLLTSVEQVISGEAQGHPFETFLGTGLYHRVGSTGIIYLADGKE